MPRASALAVGRAAEERPIDMEGIMRQVIDGVLYDTEAEGVVEIGSASSPTAHPGDFGFWQETLYRSPGGSFFLAGEGGARSSWSKPTPGGGSRGGKGIRALSDDEAREWAEKWLRTETYLKHFDVEPA